MATKYKTAFNKLKAIWKRTGKVKGVRRVKWSGKRGAFSAIAKAASKETSKKPTKKRKAPKRRTAAKKRKAPKRRKLAARRKAPKRRAKPRRKVAKKPRRKAPKRSAPRAKRKQPRKKTNPGTGLRIYVVGGRSRKITTARANELRKGGKKVRLAKIQKRPKRGAGRRGRAGIGTVVVLAGIGAAIIGGGIYLATRKKAQ